MQSMAGICSGPGAWGSSSGTPDWRFLFGVVALAEPSDQFEKAEELVDIESYDN
jgi:hypothetical protein